MCEAYLMSGYKPYNATVFCRFMDGTFSDVMAAEVNEDGLILRSNFLTDSGLEGSAEYDALLRESLSDMRLTIERDNCAGYRNAINGFFLS